MSGLVLVLGRRFPPPLGCRAVPATSLGAGLTFSLAVGLGLFAWVSGGPVLGVVGFAAGLAHGQVPLVKLAEFRPHLPKRRGRVAFPAACC